jgi:hypothetical protein
MTDFYSDTYSDAYVPGTSQVSVAGQAGYAIPLNAAIPPPGVTGTQCPVVMTPGDWLFAIVAWRQTAAGEGISFSVSDDAGNWWDPVGLPTGTSSASGTCRIAVWRCPAARQCYNVMAEPTGVPQACCITVLDVEGMGPGVTDTHITTAHSNSGTSLSALTQPAPASQAFQITGFCCAEDSATPELTGTGWTTFPDVSASNGQTTSSDLVLSAAWQLTSGTTSASWSLSSGDAATALAGISCGDLVTGAVPSQPGANWPATILELAPGQGPSTPPDTLEWVNTTSRFLSLDATQGRQYQLSQLQAGQGTLTLDNPDGAVTPPGSGSWAGITSGCPARLRQYWAGGPWMMSFTSTGSEALPAASTGDILAVTGSTNYVASMWLACSPPWPAGMLLILDWYTSGGSLITTSPGSVLVTGPVPVLAVTAGTSPSNARLAGMTIQAQGIPPSSVTFYAAAAISGA